MKHLTKDQRRIKALEAEIIILKREIQRLKELNFPRPDKWPFPSEPDDIEPWKKPFTPWTPGRPVRPLRPYFGDPPFDDGPTFTCEHKGYPTPQ